MSDFRLLINGRLVKGAGTLRASALQVIAG